MRWVPYDELTRFYHLLDPLEDHAADDAARSLRCLAWSHAPDPTDETHVVDYAVLLRAAGQVRAVHDRRLFGLFDRTIWHDNWRQAGFSVEEVQRPLHGEGAGRGLHGDHVPLPSIGMTAARAQRGSVGWGVRGRGAKRWTLAGLVALAVLWGCAACGRRAANADDVAGTVELPADGAATNGDTVAGHDGTTEDHDGTTEFRGGTDASERDVSERNADALDPSGACTPVTPPPPDAPGRAPDPTWQGVTACDEPWLRCAGDAASRVHCAGKAIPFGACFVGAPPPTQACVVTKPSPPLTCALPRPGFLPEGETTEPTLAVQLYRLDAETLKPTPVTTGSWFPTEHGIQGKFHLAINPYVVLPVGAAASEEVLAELHAEARTEGPDCPVAANAPVPKALLERVDDPPADLPVPPGHAAYRVPTGGATPAGDGAALGLYLVFGASGQSCAYCGRHLFVRVAVRAAGSEAWGQAIVPVRIYDTRPPDGGG